MKVSDIKKVLILGAGTMGQQIAVQCAIHDYNTTIYDVYEESLEKAEKRMEKLLNNMITMKVINNDKKNEILKRISFTSNAEEAAMNADLVNESIPEDPKLKGKVFSQFNDLCPDHTIFTTNTSTLVPSMFADATGRPDKFAALHFHDIRVTNIVDVMPHPGTSEDTTKVVTDFAVSIGQIPIVMKKENPGYVFNSMISALFKSAHTLAANGVASFDDIDRAWMGVTRMPIGPFGLMDSIGIDTVWKVTDYWAQKVKDKQNQKNALFLKKYVDKGLLGQKSGSGFYSYPKPDFADPDFVSKIKKD